jgi:hypothetical protein
VNVKIADRIKTAVILVTALIMGYALFVSRDHITYVAHLIRLTGYQAETLFVFIDLPAMIGKVLQLKYFAVSTHKVGRKLMIATGSLSLVCNIVAGFFGGGYGPAGYGAFIVVMFVVLESVIVKIRPAIAVTRKKNAEAIKTPKPVAKSGPSRKCPKGCTCGKHRTAANVAPTSPAGPSVPSPSAAMLEDMLTD